MLSMCTFSDVTRLFKFRPLNFISIYCATIYLRRVYVKLQSLMHAFIMEAKKENRERFVSDISANVT